MKKLCLMLLVAAACAGSPLRAQIVVDYFKATGDNPRAEGGFSLDGGAMAHFRALLSTPRYFGTNGIVRERVSIRGGVGVIGASSLSGAGVFFTGRVSAASYTDSEKSNLLAWVRNGGNLIMTTDDSGHGIVDLFGVTANTAEDTLELSTPVSADHPILNGPFGRVSQFFQSGDLGFYTGIPTNFVAVARNRQGVSLLAIPEGALGAGSGRVVLIANTNVFAHPVDDFSQPMSDILSLNILAWVARGTVNTGAPTPCFLPRVFAQFADGSGITSTLTLVNASDVSMFTGTIQFAGDNAAALPISINGQAPASTVNFSIPPLGSRSFATPGTGNLIAGSASLCNAPSTVAGTLLFSAPGLGISGVGLTPASAGLIIPVARSNRAGTNTGLAVVNASDTATVLTFTLRDQNGAVVPNGSISYPARGYFVPGAHLSKFIQDIIPSIPDEFNGTLTITAAPSTLLAAVALQIGNGAMTTLPVTPLP